MTPFAMIFMTVSMASVTGLAAYCLFRILSGHSQAYDDSPDAGADE